MVVEIEIDPSQAEVDVIVRRIIIICMMQVTVITVCADGSAYWEMWSMAGHQDRLGPGVYDAYNRMTEGQ